MRLSGPTRARTFGEWPAFCPLLSWLSFLLRQPLVNLEQKQVSLVLQAKTRPQISCRFEEAMPVVQPGQVHHAVTSPESKSNRGFCWTHKPSGVPLSLCLLPLVQLIHLYQLPVLISIPLMVLKHNMDLLVGVRLCIKC